MRKEQAEEHIRLTLQPGDDLVGFFQAVTPINFGMFFLIGPLAALTMKQYYVAATRKGMYFHRLNMLGKFKDFDYFSFDEITGVRFGKGVMQRPLRLQFANGRTLKLKALLKGVEKVAKLTDTVQQHLETAIPSLA